MEPDHTNLVYDLVLDHKNWRLEVQIHENELFVKITVHRPIYCQGVYLGEWKDFHKSAKLVERFKYIERVRDHMTQGDNLDLNIKRKILYLIDRQSKKKIFSIKLVKQEGTKQLKAISSKHMKKQCWLNWIDERCKNFEHVQIVGQKMKSKTKDFITLFGRIGLKNKFIFSIKFNKGFKNCDERNSFHKKEDSIGINFEIFEEMNADWINYSRSGQFSSLTFFGVYQDKFPRIQKGDIVTMMGDRSQGIFEIKINQKIICKKVIIEFCDEINNNQFVPFVSLRNKGQVTLICNFPDIAPIPIFLAEEIFEWDFDVMHEVYNIIEIMNLGKVQK